MPTRRTPARRASCTGASASRKTLKPSVPSVNARNVARLNDAVAIAPANAPSAERRREQPEGAGADVQRVRGEQRHERVEVEADEPDARDDDEDGAHLTVAPGEGRALPRPREQRDAAIAARPDGARPSRIASSATRTARKLSVLTTKQTPTPRRCDDDAGDRGPDHPRSVEQARVEGDGVRELAPADHLESEGLPPGRVEHEGDAAERGQDVDDRQASRCPSASRRRARRRSTIAATCVQITSRRVSTRSTIEPAKSPNSVNGANRQKSSAATASGERESESTSQASATFCIHEPASETICPAKKRR